jgi:hypothetical protein
MSAIPQRPRADLATLLRTADWLDRDRATGYVRLFAIILGAALLGWIVLSRSGIDPSGKALGTDFTSFYAASVLALKGQALDVYSTAAHGAAQTAIFGRDIGYAAFFYPPIYLLLCLPLGLVPYMASLALWQASTLIVYWRVARQFGGSRLGALPLFAFPAVMLNIGHGQNAFLSAGLFGAGILWLDRRPVLAGMMFGALAYKPHLGLVIPLVLILMGRWTAFAAAGATVLALVGLSAALFGVDAWFGFLTMSKLATATLQHGLVEPEKMQSAYAAIRVLGGSSSLAFGVQAVVTLGVMAALVWSVRQKPTTMAAGVLMVMAALMASPFLLDYDLVLLALPMAWLFREAMRTGFRPYEKIVLLASFVLPLVARTLAQSAGLPIGPLVILALFAVVARRAVMATACDNRAA